MKKLPQTRSQSVLCVSVFFRSSCETTRIPHKQGFVISGYVKSWSFHCAGRTSVHELSRENEISFVCVRNLIFRLNVFFRVKVFHSNLLGIFNINKSHFHTVK